MHRSYPIYIGEKLLDQGELLRKHIKGKRVLIVTNTTIAPLYLEKCKKALLEGGKLQVDEVILPDGEEHKSMDVLQQVRRLQQFCSAAGSAAEGAVSWLGCAGQPRWRS